MVNAINSTQVTSALISNNSPQYPENLSKICESCDPNNINFGKYTDKQMNDAFNKINAREYAAFGHLAGDASLPGIKKLAEAYINYINQLSPEEQNSGRYKGTKESMTALLAGANAMIAEEKANPGKTPVKPTSLLEMMLDEMMKNLKKNHIHADASSNAANSADQVTISEEARKISGQT